MPKFERERVNPITMIGKLFKNVNMEHITYDADLKKGDIDIIRQQVHDGTLLFTYDLFAKCLEGIVGLDHNFVYSTKHDVDWDNLKHIKYTIGDIKHTTVHGMFFLPCSDTHKYPGMRERLRMPVKCEYIY